MAGLPAPAVPMLLGAGAALRIRSRRSLRARALGTLCRFSLDPDSFIRDAKERFVAHRMRYLVLATAWDIEAAPSGIPRARQIPPEALQHPHDVLPRDRETVSYCAEPGEATSARMALRAAIAFNHVHPLSGGLEGRRQAGFPVEPLEHVSSVNNEPTPRN
jgi:rhodanese-related sulfurtransferase